jgi:hypothetical protein
VHEKLRYVRTNLRIIELTAVVVGSVVLAGYATGTTAVPEPSPLYVHEVWAPPTQWPTPEVTQPVASRPYDQPLRIARIDGCMGSAQVDPYTDEMTIPHAGQVVPPQLDSVSQWVGTDGLSNGTQILTTFLYGHVWIEDAVFNCMRYLNPGDELTITTVDGDSYVFVFQQFFYGKKQNVKNSVPASELLKNQPEYQVNDLDRLIAVFCNRTEQVPDDQATTENGVAVFIRKQQ